MLTWEKITFCWLFFIGNQAKVLMLKPFIVETLLVLYLMEQKPTI